MKNIIIFISAIVFFSVISAQGRSRYRNITEGNERNKRQSDDPDFNRRYLEAIKSTPECQPYNPAVPNYWTSERRVSQAKCLEIVWDINLRKVKKERLSECQFAVNEKLGLFSGGGAVGGRKARDGEFPHMGAVGWKASQGTWIFKCGATLISEQFVLTAGHCIRISNRDTTVSDPVPKIVRLGDNNILDNGLNGKKAVDAIISRIIPGPDYQPPKMYNDIAIMKFREPVKFTYNLHPACLWGSHSVSQLGKQATLTGWGVVETARRTTSPDLQVVVLDFIEQERCDALLKPSCNRRWCGLQSNQMCSGKLEGGVDACQGDSGGPLQVRIKLPKDILKEQLHYVIGVTSFGIGCAKANTPGVYTRVSSYIDWIEQTVWGVHGFNGHDESFEAE